MQTLFSILAKKKQPEDNPPAVCKQSLTNLLKKLTYRHAAEFRHSHAFNN